ncbi:unnamed protein product [Prorocentrum cordatum]|uniref:Uncharacterized protein n=1 Tax=Prorocentrum cordatum TaxID=2364126 RepID=A0ABN9TRV5_9DINO|nr:unnamed protein product [Polarella glacialis]
MTSSALRFSGERTDDAPLEQQLGSPCRVAAPAEAQEHVPRGRLSTCPSPAGAAMPTRARAHGGGTSRARRGEGARGERIGEDTREQTYQASGPHLEGEKKADLPSIGASPVAYGRPPGSREQFTQGPLRSDGGRRRPSSRLRPRRCVAAGGWRRPSALGLYTAAGRPWQPGPARLGGKPARRDPRGEREDD